MTWRENSSLHQFMGLLLHYVWNPPAVRLWYMIYPNDQIVVFKSCPVIIVLDPAFVFKDFSWNGSIQFIQIQVKVPTVLIDLCAAGRLSDDTPVVMIVRPEKKIMLMGKLFSRANMQNEHVNMKWKLNRCMPLKIQKGKNYRDCIKYVCR